MIRHLTVRFSFLRIRYDSSIPERNINEFHNKISLFENDKKTSQKQLKKSHFNFWN